MKLELLLLLFILVAHPSYAMSVKTAIESIGDHTNMMPRQRGVTLPMIKMENERLILRRIYYIKIPRPGAPTEITYPTFIASYDLTNGKFIALKKFKQQLTIPDNQPWLVNFHQFNSPSDIIKEFNTIWECYEALIPIFLESGKRDPNKTEITKAKELVKLIDRHLEKPLQPVYDFYGSEFFDFIRSTAR